MTDMITERTPGSSSRRTAFLTASLASLMAIAIAAPAEAQTTPAAPPPPATLPADTADTADNTAKDIVVTGSRITTGGFTAPTPTQTIGAVDIARNAVPPRSRAQPRNLRERRSARAPKPLTIPSTTASPKDEGK